MLDARVENTKHVVETVELLSEAEATVAQCYRSDAMAEVLGEHSGCDGNVRRRKRRPRVRHLSTVAQRGREFLDFGPGCQGRALEGLGWQRRNHLIGERQLGTVVASFDSLQHRLEQVKTICVPYDALELGRAVERGGER